MIGLSGSCVAKPRIQVGMVLTDTNALLRWGRNIMTNVAFPAASRDLARRPTLAATQAMARM